MTPDGIGSLVRQILTALLTSAAAAAYLDNQQAIAVATAVGTLVSIGWSIWAHWNMDKVPASRNGGK